MAKGEKIGLFPGTFDPFTNGHLDVIRRGERLFDRLIVAIAENPAKAQLFTMEERQAMIDTILREQFNGQVQTACYRGLTVDYARKINATAILRGLRNVTDLNFEFQLALTNRAVADVETVFVMSDESFGFTSSTLIKQIAAGGEIDRLGRMLPRPVIDALKHKKAEHGGTLPWRHVDHFKE